MQGFRHSSFNSSSQQTRQQLEQLLNAPAASSSTTASSATASSAMADWLKTAGRALRNFLTGTQELRIWTQDTKAGKVWKVYDPVGDRSRQYHSEQALRIWLEQRHRQ